MYGLYHMKDRIVHNHWHNSLFIDEFRDYFAIFI